MRNSQVLIPKRKGPRSLFAILVLSFSIITIFSCVAIGLVTYYMRAEGIRNQMFKQLETVRDEKIQRFSSWFAERVGDVRIATVRHEIVDFCDTQEPGRRVEKKNEIERTLMGMRDSYNYGEVFLGDSAGEIIATTEHEAVASTALPQRNAFLLRTIAEKQVVVSDVLISKVLNIPVLFLMAPVYRHGTSEVIGVLGILVDPSKQLYPQFTRSEYLGMTGEVLLVSKDRIAQSPLKYNTSQPTLITITAEPATLGAAGETGIVAVNDYRPVPVMAAYGYIPEFKWGIVAKQDIYEINEPVRDMAKNIAGVSLTVLLCTLIIGFFLARRIAKPAINISQAANQIGAGQLDVRAPQEGPAEIQDIAVNLNNMVKQLRSRINVAGTVGELSSAASKHKSLEELFDEILPELMKTTRSQLGVVYVSGGTPNKLDRVLVHGISPEKLPDELTVSPPDSLLCESFALGQAQHLQEIPEGSSLKLSSQAGETSPKALLSVPLILRDVPVGVIGLASIFEYSDNSIQVAQNIQGNLAQAVEICMSFAQSEKLSDGIEAKNRDLQAANEELESFGYSISHDLRAPLRAIDGFSKALLDDNAKDLDEAGKGYLDRIRAGAQRMGRLIDDLLQLSRLSRVGLIKTEVNLSAMVPEIVDDFQSGDPDRNVEITVKQGLVALADETLLRTAMQNLLANAWKFTSEQKEAKIEVGSTEIDGERAFFVRDNGVGFDMAYEDKLFGVFQRLHDTSEFPGTGVGLATVHRVMKRHGGHVWANSTVDMGATFYFSLPSSEYSKGDK